MPGLDHIVIKSLAFMQYLYSKIIDDIIMISFLYRNYTMVRKIFSKTKLKF